MRDTNCKNCGAVMHGDVCEYCGTNYGPKLLVLKNVSTRDMDDFVDNMKRYGIVKIKSVSEVGFI